MQEAADAGGTPEKRSPFQQSLEAARAASGDSPRSARSFGSGRGPLQQQLKEARRELAATQVSFYGPELLCSGEILSCCTRRNCSIWRGPRRNLIRCASGTVSHSREAAALTVLILKVYTPGPGVMLCLSV